jgi:hypothetical protein
LNRNRRMYQQTHHQHDANPAEIDIHKECKNQCRSSIILTCIDNHPESLAIADDHGRLPLHILLRNTSSSIDIALIMIEKYPAALQHRDYIGDLPLHHECKNQCRSSIISRCIELYPEALAIADGQGFLPLHLLIPSIVPEKYIGVAIRSESSSVEDALMMIEKYPAALQHRDYFGYLPLHIECRNRCRSAVISKSIELYPEGLAVAIEETLYLPMHMLLSNELSIIDDALTMIEKYPAALQHQTQRGHLPLHIECFRRCRSTIISKCIELYPEGLAVASEETLRLPMHLLLRNDLSTIDDALTITEEYREALQHRDKHGYLPLHIECFGRCRSSIISKCIELYPEGLAVTTEETLYLPLHLLLQNKLSTIDDALMMIEKYPAALQHRDYVNYLPLHIECKNQCRSSIIMRCIELYPESVDDGIIDSVLDKINEHNYHQGSGYRSVVTMIFTIRPMSLYRRRASNINDIRTNPDYRRQILNLLPRHVFTPRHELDYRDLNWQPRAAMMMLLSQMKIQQHTSSSYV